jgi:hypothetical protein
LFFSSFFDFGDLAVIFFFKICSFQGSFGAEKSKCSRPVGYRRTSYREISLFRD